MVKSTLARYLEDNFLFQFDSEITDSTDLFKAGIIDSFGYLKLMSFIKDTYQVRLSKDELLSNVVATLTGLVELVESRAQAA